VLIVCGVQHSLNAFKTITFLPGLTPALIGSGAAWGIYFFSYNRAKERYQNLTGQGRLNPMGHLASAAEAGGIVCLITNPIWVVKTRLQLQNKNSIAKVASRAPVSNSSTGGTIAEAVPAAARKVVGTIGRASSSAANRVPKIISTGDAYSGFLDCLYKIAITEGVQGLYKGLLPSLFLVSHGAIQFAVYEELKSAAHHIHTFIRPLDTSWTRTPSDIKASCSRIKNHSSSPTGHELTSIQISACGALSKLLASVATYPSQVIRSRLQQRMETRALKYSGVVDVLRMTLAREGLRGFYKGLLPNVLRVMPQSALTFLVYESMIRQLNKLVEKNAAE